LEEIETASAAITVQGDRCLEAMTVTPSGVVTSSAGGLGHALIGQSGQLEQFQWFIRASLETSGDSLSTGNSRREDGRQAGEKAIGPNPA
jgi:hypothetical protein